MKEMFRGVLQEALEAEMDEQLGYDRYDMSDKETANRRNGYSKKTTRYCFTKKLFHNTKSRL